MNQIYFKLDQSKEHKQYIRVVRVFIQFHIYYEMLRIYPKIYLIFGIFEANLTYKINNTLL